MPGRAPGVAAQGRGVVEPTAPPLARQADSFFPVQGGSLRTWRHSSPFVEQVQVFLTTEGRPLDADIELWRASDDIPVKMRVYSEDGQVRPFNAVIATPRGPSTVAIRNVGQLEFPFDARVVHDNVASPSLECLDSAASVQGEGSMRTFHFDPTVSSVQVLVQSRGNPLNARIELIQGPDNNRQVIELYTEDGCDRPFFCFLETPGAGSVIRVINTAPMEYPLTASVVAHSLSDPRVDDYYGHEAVIGGADEIHHERHRMGLAQQQQAEEIARQNQPRAPMRGQEHHDVERAMAAEREAAMRAQQMRAQQQQQQAQQAMAAEREAAMRAQQMRAQQQQQQMMERAAADEYDAAMRAQQYRAAEQAMAAEKEKLRRANEQKEAEEQAMKAVQEAVATRGQRQHAAAEREAAAKRDAAVHEAVATRAQRMQEAAERAEHAEAAAKAAYLARMSVPAPAARAPAAPAPMSESGMSDYERYLAQRGMGAAAAPAAPTPMPPSPEEEAKRAWLASKNATPVPATPQAQAAPEPSASGAFMSEYEKYLANRGTRPEPPAAEPDASASGAFKSEYEKYLANRGRPQQQREGTGLRDEFGKWVSAGERERATM